MQMQYSQQQKEQVFTEMQSIPIHQNKEEATRKWNIRYKRLKQTKKNKEETKNLKKNQNEDKEKHNLYQHKT